MPTADPRDVEIADLRVANAALFRDAEEYQAEIARLSAVLREIRDHCEPWPARLAGDVLPSATEGFGCRALDK